MDMKAFHENREDLITKTTAEIKRAEDTEKSLRFSETLVQREIHLARLQTDVQLNRLETKAQMTLKSVVGNEIKRLHEIVAQFNDVIDRLKSPPMTIPTTTEGPPDISIVSNMVKHLSNKLERKKVKFHTNSDLDKTFKEIDSFGELTLVKALPVARIAPELNVKRTPEELKQYRNNEGAGINGSKKDVDKHDETNGLNFETDHLTTGELLVTNSNKTSVLGKTGENPFSVLRAMNEKQRTETVLDKHKDDMGKQRSTRNQHHSIKLLPNSGNAASKDIEDIDEQRRGNEKKGQNDNPHRSMGLSPMPLLAVASKGIGDRHMHRTGNDKLERNGTMDGIDAGNTDCPDNRVKRGDKSIIMRRSRSMSPKSARTTYKDNLLGGKSTHKPPVKSESRPVRGYAYSNNNAANIRGNVVVKKEDKSGDKCGIVNNGQWNNCNEVTRTDDTCKTNGGLHEIRIAKLIQPPVGFTSINSPRDQEVEYKPNSNTITNHINGPASIAKSADSSKLDLESMDVKLDNCNTPTCVDNQEERDFKLSGTLPRYQITKHMQTDLDIQYETMRRKHALQLKRLRNRSINTVHNSNNRVGATECDNKYNININSAGNKEAYGDSSDHSFDKQGREIKTSHLSSLGRSAHSETDSFVSHFCTMRRRRNVNKVNDGNENRADNNVINASYGDRNEDRDQEVTAKREMWTGCEKDKRNVGYLLNGGKGKSNVTNTQDDVTDKLGIKTEYVDSGDVVKCAEIDVNVRDKEVHRTVQRHDGSTRNRLPSFKEMLFISK